MRSKKGKSQNFASSSFCVSRGGSGGRGRGRRPHLDWEILDFLASMSVCVCVCVCVYKRERERDKTAYAQRSWFLI